MNPTENVRPPLTGHPTPVEVSAELIQVAGGGLRTAEVGLVADHRVHGSTLFLHRVRS
jgi:hypothetical protein